MVIAVFGSGKVAAVSEAWSKVARVLAAELLNSQRTNDLPLKSDQNQVEMVDP